MDKEGRSPLLSAQDPFYAVRDALEGELRTLRVKFDGWKGLLHSVDTSADVGFKLRHEEVKKDIIKVGDLLRKVRASVLNVEQNRGKFSHIDDRELAARKGAVDELDAVRAARSRPPAAALVFLFTPASPLPTPLLPCADPHGHAHGAQL